MHLFDVTDQSHRVIIASELIIHTHIREALTGPKIPVGLSWPVDRLHSLAVTLLADRFGQFTREMGRVRDGEVFLRRVRVLAGRIVFVLRRVQLTGTVAPLTADLFFKDIGLINNN